MSDLRISEWADYIEKGWHYCPYDYYNNHISYEKNLENGCDLPEEDKLVICFDPDEQKYFIGRFIIPYAADSPVAYDSLSGRQYSRYVLWTYMPDFCYM